MVGFILFLFYFCFFFKPTLSTSSDCDGESGALWVEQIRNKGLAWPGEKTWEEEGIEAGGAEPWQSEI